MVFNGLDGTSSDVLWPDGQGPTGDGVSDVLTNVSDSVGKDGPISVVPVDTGNGGGQDVGLTDVDPGQQDNGTPPLTDTDNPSDLLDPVDTGIDVQPDVPTGPPPGCLGANLPFDGFNTLQISGPATQKAAWGAQPTVQFSAEGVLPSGQTQVTSATWQVDPVGAGTFDATGGLHLSGNWAGTAQIYAHHGTLCTSTSLTITLNYVDSSAEPQLGLGANFAGTAVSGAPVALDLVYPPDGALVPKDFAPITFQWLASGGANAFDLRFTSQVAQIDVVGGANWAKGPGYVVTIPAATWAKLFALDQVDAWTVQVLQTSASGGKAGAVSGGKTQVLKVTQQMVGGALYYWNTSYQAVRVLESGQTSAKSLSTAGGMCPGCHSISPDGSTVAVSFMTGSGFSSMSMALFTAKSGQTPPWLHPNAASKLAASFTISAAFSKAHFTATDKRLVVPSSGSFLPITPTKLQVVDLLLGTGNPLVQGGDLGQQAWPTWSSDGTKIVYVSGKSVGQGFSASEKTQLYSVPFNNGSGGNATELSGANDPAYAQFYPVFSPDGAYVVYNRAADGANNCAQNAGNTGANGGPNTSDNSYTYDNCHSELWAVPAAGGKAVRLDAANAGTDQTNSWPTFGNVVGQHHWLGFSSRRNYGFLHTGSPAAPQIWISAMDPAATQTGADGSFPALWLPGQDIDAGCHLARWSETPRDK